MKDQSNSQAKYCKGLDNLREIIGSLRKLIQLINLYLVMIICDTNIWYRLPKDIVDANSLQNRLVCTHTTLAELNRSHVMYSRPEEAKKAIRTIGEFASIRGPNPYEFGLSKFINDYRLSDSNARFLWKGLINYLNLEFEPSIIDQERIRDYLKKGDEGFINAINFMNERAAEIQINNKGKVAIERDYISHSKRFISEFLVQYFQIETNYSSPIGISLNHEGWNQIELFLEVWTEWFKRIDFRNGKKIKPNDWADILNMIYVGPNDQYWTNEIEWIKIMKSNPKTAKYCFELKL